MGELSVMIIEKMVPDLISHYKIQAGAKVLDVGCGNGLALKLFAMVDVSQLALVSARRRKNAAMRILKFSNRTCHSLTSLMRLLMSSGAAT